MLIAEPNLDEILLYLLKLSHDDDWIYSTATCRTDLVSEF